VKGVQDTASVFMIWCTLTFFLAFSLSAVPSAQSDDLTARKRKATLAMRAGRFDEAAAILERAAAAQPSDIETRWLVADVYSAAGRPIDAVGALLALTERAPEFPIGWYALGRAYNAVKQQALDAFRNRPEAAPWRQLVAADALLSRGQLTYAFVLYRATFEQLPTMVSIHDSVAQIYESTGHADWTARERAKGVLPASDCAARAPLCEFRAGRYRSALTGALAGADLESKYWRARAANELAIAAFKRLDGVPDSVERRIVHATVAHAEERFVDAVTELKAALVLRPDDPELLYDLASSCFDARDFDQAIAVLAPMLKANPDDVRLLKLEGYAFLEQQRPDEALPILQRATARESTDADLRLALGRAYLQTGDFTAAVPIIEAALDTDQDATRRASSNRAIAESMRPSKASS
jgi:predicted Zn-dependent protease